MTEHPSRSRARSTLTLQERREKHFAEKRFLEDVDVAEETHDPVKLDPEEYPLLNLVDARKTWDGGTKPKMLVPGLVVQGYHHLAYGMKENGKTLTTLGLVVKPLLEQGATVLWVDKEMGRTAIFDHLKTLGVPRDVAIDFFVYLELPLLDGSKNPRLEWHKLLLACEPKLVVVDAQAGVLAGAGLNENASGDVLKWDSWYLESARRLGATTYMIDHVGYEDASRPRGASGKGAAAKVELLFKAQKFDREKVGAVDITCKKNSLAADIPNRQTYEVGGTPFRLQPAKTTKTTLSFDNLPKTDAVVKIATYLQQNLGPRTLKDVIEGARVDRTTLHRRREDLENVASIACNAEAKTYEWVGEEK